MPPLTPADETWRGMPFYDPPTYPPLPRPEPARPSLIRRAVAFAVGHVDSALIFLLCVDAVLAAARGVS
jgi:hypothetical protein